LGPYQVKIETNLTSGTGINFGATTTNLSAKVPINTGRMGFIRIGGNNLIPSGQRQRELAGHSLSMSVAKMIGAGSDPARYSRRKIMPSFAGSVTEVAGLPSLTRESWWPDPIMGGTVW
jgi:hypothetical protein